MGEVENPDVRIILFQNAEYARLPIATWPSSWHYPLGQISQDQTHRYRVAIDRHTGTVAVFDMKSRVCGVWAYEVARLPYWWVATPFRLQFSWIADTFDAELIHAAAVSDGNNGYLLTGVSGSGKSTVTHQLAEEGVKAISDDFVLVENHHISSPFLRTKLHDSSLEMLPNLWTKVLNQKEVGQKRIVEGAISPVTEPVSLRSIFLVRVGDSSTILPESRTQIFRDLAIGTIPGVLGGNLRSLSRITSTIRHSTTWRFQTSDSQSRNIEEWKNFVANST